MSVETDLLVEGAPSPQAFVLACGLPPDSRHRLWSWPIFDADRQHVLQHRSDHIARIKLEGFVAIRRPI